MVQERGQLRSKVIARRAVIDNYLYPDTTVCGLVELIFEVEVLDLRICRRDRNGDRRIRA